jgi:rubredoxin
MKYICSYCNVFVYDTINGDKKTGLRANTPISSIPEEWRCPVCGKNKDYLRPITDEMYREKVSIYQKSNLHDAKPQTSLEIHRERSREILMGICSVNKVCDGLPERLCMGMKYGKAIGFGGAGQGKTFEANYRALASYSFKTRLVKPHREPEMGTDFLGISIELPVMVTSISGVRISMNNVIPEDVFQRGMIEGARQAGTIGLSGNTVDYPDHPGVEVIKELGGFGIPIFKPQTQESLFVFFKRAELAGCPAVGVDLDGCGSTNWTLRGKPVYRKGERELKELVDSTELPVIFKGIMSLDDAGKVVDSGAKALDVSNHGGRVLDFGQGVAEVLPEIAEIFGDKITIMADGAIRTGFDVLKVLALGADVALIGRPFARMALSGGAEAVKQYIEYVKSDLRRGMLMTGCDSLDEVTNEILVMNKYY